MGTDIDSLVLTSLMFATQVLDLVLTHLGGLRRWWQPKKSSSDPSEDQELQGKQFVVRDREALAGLAGLADLLRGIALQNTEVLIELRQIRDSVSAERSVPGPQELSNSDGGSGEFDELSISNHHTTSRNQIRLVDLEEEFQDGIFPELQALCQSRRWRKEKPTFAHRSSLHSLSQIWSKASIIRVPPCWVCCVIKDQCRCGLTLESGSSVA
jgi:hypothetical protein